MPHRVHPRPAGVVAPVVTRDGVCVVVWDCSEHDIGNLLAAAPGAFLRAPRPLVVPAHVADPYGEPYPDVSGAGVTTPTHCASGDTADCAKVGAPG